MVTAKGRATRDRIVAAAATLMCTRGVAATSTEDVQVAANVSSSQIYHYFADKRSLTRAVIEHQTDAIVGTQETLLARLDTLDALHAWAELIVTFHGMAVTEAAAHSARWPANSPKTTPMRAKTSQRATGAGNRRSAPAWPPWQIVASSCPAPMSTGWRSHC